jgi:branched-chain amino acid transport system ATP-binding protein
MAGAGIGRTFQNLALFASMSVRENLRVGCHGRHPAGFVGALLRLPGERRVEREAQGRADELLRFLALEDCAERVVADLPFGTQKRVELGRALCGQPRLLLLDEPSFGLAPLIVRDIFEIMRRINAEQGVSILLVEQNAALALDIADSVYLMETGRIVLHGTPQEVRADDAVRRVYLGG